MSSEKGIALAKAQARDLREQARNGGLRFETHLTPDLADWVLDMIERGIFISPSEATFVILGEHMELEPHRDLREELMRRRVQAALDDPSPLSSSEEVYERIRRRAATMGPAASWSDEFLTQEI